MTTATIAAADAAGIEDDVPPRARRSRFATSVHYLAIWLVLQRTSLCLVARTSRVHALLLVSFRFCLVRCLNGCNLFSFFLFFSLFLRARFIFKRRRRLALWLGTFLSSSFFFFYHHAVTRGYDGFSPTVLRFFCMRFFTKIFCFFWVFLGELVSRNGCRLCGLFLGKRKRTQPRVNTTLLLLRQKSVARLPARAYIPRPRNHRRRFPAK